MFTKSIRWRLQLWLAFLLVCILSGFSLTAYQLHRTNRLNQINEDLQRRVAAVSGDVRRRPPFGEHGERPRADSELLGDLRSRDAHRRHRWESGLAYSGGARFARNDSIRPKSFDNARKKFE
jgi:hypothetical protein